MDFRRGDRPDHEADENVAPVKEFAVVEFTAPVAIGADSSVKTETLNLLAYAYATDGQRDKAIATYQKLINLLQQQSSNTGHAAFVYGQNPIQVYQNDMQILEGGGSL